ncbi:MAG: ADP-ribose pyrophosphatase [Deinococcus sp.]|nr:ADP-ribose pyrophosphatase [Deinococcus sp.]
MRADGPRIRRRQEGLPAVFVGRFQPPHTAHVATIVQALGQAPRVLVLLGSANLARSIRNPFSAPERARMLRAALLEMGADPRQVRFRALPDRFDADRWAADVRWQAAQVFGPAQPVALVGFEKDASTAYLRWFPGWARLPVPGVPGLNATDIRAALFEGLPWPSGLPDSVRAFLTGFVLTPAFARLHAEWEAVRHLQAAVPSGAHLHEERWVRLSAQHIWLQTRTQPIGRGLWELPGRVLSPGVQPVAVADAIFDHPARSLVAHTTAHVYRGDPPPDSRYAASRPVPLTTAVARPRRFFEDHHVILGRLLENAAF